VLVLPALVVLAALCSAGPGRTVLEVELVPLEGSGFSVDPSTLQFELLTRGEPVTQTFKITNLGSQDQGFRFVVLEGTKFMTQTQPISGPPVTVDVAPNQDPRVERAVGKGSAKFASDPGLHAGRIVRGESATIALTFTNVTGAKGGQALRLIIEPVALLSELGPIQHGDRMADASVGPLLCTASIRGRVGGIRRSKRNGRLVPPVPLL
jgi:hypothetical protein